jgi:hypothetical protein
MMPFNIKDDLIGLVSLFNGGQPAGRKESAGLKLQQCDHKI